VFSPAEICQNICLVPVIGGSVYSILTVWSAGRFFNKSQPSATGKPSNNWQPPVTVLKPVRGLEKDLKANLRSICTQNYPQYQVVYSIQDPADPALPILQEIQAEFGSQRVSLTLSTIQAGANGKVNNLLGAIAEARHDIFIISDSDTNLPPDYITTIVAPLANPDVGCVCTPFKVVKGDRWFEKLELLTMNGDFMPSVIFAEVTGAAKACLGPSIAIKRSTLEALGGLESLADYLVEDYELGRRLWTSGKQAILLPYLINATVDLKDWRQWWTHQVYWDQNTYLAQPLPFVATILIRAIPFALLLAIVRLGDTVGLSVLVATIALRLLTAALVAVKLGDGETLRSLYLLPLRDILGLIFWGLAFTQRTVVWRGVEFKLTGNGKMVPL
jgi:ceramide glucosyltransferase